ncbi:MAG: porin [Pigmentiphaga sp.]|uniref:porin n=1 Tax=Pigmentiphaga sp. TaxID=1977564 RepID=UPI003B584666
MDLKKNAQAAVAALVPTLVAPAAAWGQVEMYGVVDASVRYIDDVGGKSQLALTAGDQMPNRLGFRGVEDLGNGLKANFVLEAGFGIDTGMSGQGGILFGRQSYVGLGNGTHTLSLGRQYDAMFSLSEFYATPYGVGGLGWATGGLDRVAGERLDNSVKYSFKRGPLSAALMTAFGEAAGDVTTRRAFSGEAKYKEGALSLGAAFTRVNNRVIAPYSALGISRFLEAATVAPGGGAIQFATDHVLNVGLGVSYDLGGVKLMGLYTQTNFVAQGASQKLRNYHVAGTFPLASGLVGTVGYTHERTDGMNRNMVMGAVNYYLSKRTDVYILALHQRNSGDNKAVLFTVPVSGSHSQSALALGLRHKF